MTLTTNSRDIYKYFQQQQFAVDHLRNEWKIVADGVADPPPRPPVPFLPASTLNIRLSSIDLH